MILNSDANEMNLLVAFMHARLDEDEQRALLAAEVIGGRWDTWEVVAQQLHACCDTVPGIGRAGQHLHRNADPAAVLRDVAARRRIVEDFRVTVSAVRRVASADLSAPGLDGMYAGRDALKSVVLLLAQRYSDHPDFLENWRRP